MDFNAHNAVLHHALTSDLNETTIYTLELASITSPSHVPNLTHKLTSIAVVLQAQTLPALLFKIQRLVFEERGE